jgi:hypothetical protein
MENQAYSEALQHLHSTTRDQTCRISQIERGFKMVDRRLYR